MRATSGGRSDAGTSLVELLTVLLIMGILTSMAAPRLQRFIVRARVRGAAQMLRADLSYARMMAVRSGGGCVVHFLPDPDCVPTGRRAGRSYVIGPRGASGPGFPVTLRMLGGRVCYDVNGSDSLVFNSRGLLASFNNRTVRTMEDDARDSITVSVAGRIFYRGS